MSLFAFPSKADSRLYVAKTVADAVAALAERGEGGAALAGATWIMRAPIRQESEHAALSYVAIGKIAELRRIEITPSEITIGACVTHAILAATLGSAPDCHGLVAAAAGAANPAIRNVATIGGNLCAADFAASDLVPALLSAAAQVEVQTPAGVERLSMERFLDRRADLGPGALLRRVIIERTSGRTAHARLPLRKAGDYPVAIVSLFARCAPNGAVVDIRICVGSVEPAARRWTRLELALLGRPLDADHVFATAKTCAANFKGRHSVEAPGWYRVHVLPELARRAVRTLQPQL